MTKRRRYLTPCLASLLASLLAWPSAVFAGAPAPVPATAGPHRPDHQVANLGDFRFESGEVVKDFKVSYVTHGKLNRGSGDAAPDPSRA